MTAQFRYGIDTAFGAAIYLSRVTLVLGDTVKARKLIEESVARAGDSDHVPALLKCLSLEGPPRNLRGHAEAALRAAEAPKVIRQTPNALSGFG